MRRLMTIAFAAVLVTAAGCTGSGDEESAVSGSALDGTWTTATVSAETEAAALRAAGFNEKAFDFFMDDLGSTTSNRYTLTFDAGTFVTENAPDGGPSAEIDDGSYTVSGDKLVFGYPDGGATTFLWSIDDGALSLTLVEDTQPKYRDRPTEIPVTGIYTAAPFHG